MAPEVNAFLQACNRHSRARIYKRHIWLLVGHTKGRQFEYWQAGSPKATSEDKNNFGRILRTSPEDFLAALRRKGIIE